MSKYNETPAKVDLDCETGKVAVSGTAWAVITIVALIGMIVISVRALDLSRSVLEDGPAGGAAERREMTD